MTAIDTTRPRRRDTAELRRASYWQRKFEEADTDSQRASVAWDHARARIKKLPPAQQEAAYERAFHALDAIAREDNRS